MDYIFNGVVNKEVTKKLYMYLKYILIVFAVHQALSLFDIEFVVASIPSAKWIGIVGALVCSLLTSYFYYKMSFVEEGFRTHSILLCVIAIFETITSIIQIGEGISLVLKFIVSILAIFGVYYKCSSFENLFIKTNTELYGNWQNIWKWNKWCYFGLLFCNTLFFIPYIAAILLFVSIIGLFLVSVIEIWYIYKTYTYFGNLLKDSEVE